MYYIKYTIIWTIIIFVALTLLTMKNEAHFDKLDTYGFPFTYYDYFEGLCDKCHDNYGFKPLYLIADILFAMTFGLLITILKRKFIDNPNG